MAQPHLPHGQSPESNRSSLLAWPAARSLSTEFPTWLHQVPGCPDESLKGSVPDLLLSTQSQSAALITPRLMMPRITPGYQKLASAMPLHKTACQDCRPESRQR